MINGYLFDKRLMISSIELYDAMNSNRKKYYHWVRRFLLKNQSLVLPRDFVFYQEKRFHQPREFLLTPALAKAILVIEGTVVSRKIRFFIEDQIETQLQRPIKTKTNVGLDLDI